ncbi:acyl-CoA thioesterase [Haematobacter genomosp. 1]|uniref:Thioeseterase n=1 Tax=Haematobacter genomosp. 1 TaxID=366618 RepID=A0A212A7N8_9RHOB|nr:acyl-CoA thioesterase [Haematobacter genomosp. 1]OWJ75468.1 thioeseterase [Haematobacter genomosp. 1]
MYPLRRFTCELLRARRQPRLAPYDTHVCDLRLMPWDMDPWRELNNGRTLTLYDIGRISLAQRTGMLDVLRRNRWGITVAGSTTRYRRRVTVFQKVEMRSRFLGWDERFFYIEQSMWREGDCTSGVLIRGALLGGGKLLPPASFIAETGWPAPPPLPDWVLAWGKADATRPWPPQI